MLTYSETEVHWSDCLCMSAVLAEQVSCALTGQHVCSVSVEQHRSLVSAITAVFPVTTDGQHAPSQSWARVRALVGIKRIEGACQNKED